MNEIKVLVVDDDRLITSTLQSGLAQFGLNVFVANSAQEARECVSKETLDLVVIDAKLPGESGFALADWLVTQRDPLPFIFLSAYSDCETVSGAIHRGALTYLVKPVQAAQVVPVIHAAMERSRELHHLRKASARIRETLEKDRDINVAVGLIVARTGLSQDAAFERMRGIARSKRQRMEELAQELICAARIMSPAPPP